MSRRGHDRERAVRRVLDAEGWWTCRAAGSLGDADVVAVKRSRYDTPRVLLVEVKSTARSPFAGFPPADRASLLAAAALTGGEAWLAYWPPRGKLQWIKAADWPPMPRPVTPLVGQEAA